MTTEPEKNGCSRWLVHAVLAGLVIYLVLFMASPYGWSGQHRISRAIFVTTTALLADQMIGDWLGPSADVFLLDRLYPLTFVAAILLVSGMLGYLALAAVRFERTMSLLEAIFFSEAVGLNLVSTYTLAVGLAGGLHRRLWFVLPAVIVVAGWTWFFRQRVAASEANPETGRTSPDVELGWISRLGPWLAGLFVVVILLGGLLPPNEFDVREYHLEVPKEFYAVGRIGFLPHNVYGNMALGAEMHALLGMVLTGDWWTGALVGKTICALFAPLTALGLVAAGRRLFSPAAGMLAALIYVSIPLVVNISTVGFIEGAAGFYLFATFYALLLAQNDSAGTSLRWLLPGYMGGASVACKYPGLLFVVAPLGAWLLWFSFTRRDREGRWKPDWAAPALFGIGVFLGCGLWLVKNWALAGNPLYPMLFGLFGGETLTAEKARMWNEVHKPAGFTLSALTSDVWQVVLGSDWHSPIVMPLAALAFLLRPRRRLVAGLAAYFAFVVAAWWCLALRIDRYWAPALPIAALMAGAGATWCRTRLWQRSLAGLVIAASLVSFITTATSPCIYPPLLASYRSLRTSPERVSPWHLYLNAHAEGTVLMVGEAQVFDLAVPILYNTWLDDSVFEAIFRDRASGGLRPVDEICEELRARNVSHVFVSWSEIGRYVSTGYGKWDFVRPELFDRLVADGVLERVPPPKGLEESVNQLYQVGCRQR
ncbi:MAG: ArnT family glycosyltransferase [Thermoguttaceae bacterium]